MLASLLFFILKLCTQCVLNNLELILDLLKLFITLTHQNSEYNFKPTRYTISGFTFPTQVNCIISSEFYYYFLKFLTLASNLIK